jgi:Tc toxin complex TcA C-terminal TcB-binding domain
MVGRLASLYFQAYNVAYATAKAAEKALQFELPSIDSFITPTHWDSLRKGLLAGDSLLLELNRTEKLHIDQDSRFLASLERVKQCDRLRRIAPAPLVLVRAIGNTDIDKGSVASNLRFPVVVVRIAHPSPRAYRSSAQAEQREQHRVKHANLSVKQHVALRLPALSC